MARKPTVRKRKGAPASRKATDAQIKKAMVKHQGLLSQAAYSLGMSRQSLHERVNTTPELYDLAQELRVGFVDAAEAVMAYQMKRHNRQAAEFVLKNLGKSRGYGPQPEIPDTPPDTSRRAQIVAILIADLDRRAAAFHQRPSTIEGSLTPTAKPNGHAAPANRPNGHGGALSPAQQLIAAKKGG